MLRETIMRTLIDLNRHFIKQWSVLGYSEIDPTPYFTQEWLSIRPNRFFLVESVNFQDEKIKTEIKLCYALTNEEAKLFGTEHEAYYKKHISTISVELKYIEDPDSFYLELQEKLAI